MPDVTKIADLKVFSWGTPTSPNPRLAAPISSTATTITVTSAPLDEDGNVVSTDFLMGIKNSDGYTETALVAASGISADGLTFTGVTRGIDVSGLDYTTSDSTLAADHGQDSPVTCVVHPFLHNQWQAALQGTIASGANNWRIGDETDSDITIYAQNADANKPFWGYDKATNQWVYSNDGVSSTPFGTGAGITGGDGITVTAGDIDVDTTDTTVFVKTSSGSGDENKVPVLDASGKVGQGFTGIIGEVRMYGGAVAPTGWVLCDGSAIDRTTYADLFAVIGTGYGVGDGATTFNVPDFRGRSPIGVGTGIGGGANGTGLPAGGDALTAVSLGTWKGEEEHTLTIAEMPAHNHDADNITVNTSASAGAGAIPTSFAAATTQGSDDPHNTIQPVMGINFIIKT